jgi:hypothetical protein
MDESADAPGSTGSDVRVTMHRVSASSRAGFDAVAAEALALAVAAGDAAAAPRLVEVLWPEWLDLLTSSRSMRALRGDEDHARNVAARLLDKLHRDDFRALRQFVEWRERHPDKTFHDWVRIVVANASRDYLRERRSAAPSAEPSARRLLDEVMQGMPLEEVGTRPAMTAAQTARQLLEFAEKHLPRPQLAALRAWLEGTDFDEMSAQLGLADPGEGRRLLRAAVAALRRAFAPTD